MLVGEPPFTGPTAQAIVAKVMTAEPAGLTGAAEEHPAGRRGAVLTALEKLPADRFATAAEFAAALVSEQVTRVRAAAQPATRLPPVGTGSRPAAAAAGLLAGALLGRGIAPRGDRRSCDDPGDARPGRQHRDPADRQHPAGDCSLRPAGRIHRYEGADAALWVRELDQASPRRLPDTKGAFGPFFSPDGESIGFFTGSSGHTAMKVISARGASPARS